MITKLVVGLFKSRAGELAKQAFKDPRMVDAFDKYIEDTKEFKARLKRLGLTSREDLKNAINNDPNLPPFVEL
jgi:hypothetical protein